jgi:xylulokinase
MARLLGFDIGTTATKAVLLDEERGAVAGAERSAALVSPRAGWAEMDPAAWWRNVGELARELAAGGPPTAVGVAGMVPCTLLLDVEGRPLRASIQQNDARAVAEIAELRAALAGARLIERTGAAVSQQSIAPTLLWVARHEPDVWARTRCVLGSYDYLVYRLTGVLGVEANWALESGLFDLETGSWADDVLEAAGVSRRLLPPVRGAAEIAGRVSARASLESGLPEGLPVVAGAADHVAAAFAAGVVSQGDLLIKLGGAGDVLLASDTPLVDERLFLDVHLIPGKYLPNGCMATTGSLVRWFQRELAGGAELAMLDEEALAAGAGAGGVLALPYFLGEKTPVNDPDARGAFVGLDLSHGRGHLYRAVLESIAYAVRHHLDVFAELGRPALRLLVGDGGSRSAVWTQIVADVVDRPLQVVEGGGAALGVAYVAGMATGAFDDWRGIERFVAVGRMVEPQAPAARELYERGYRDYRRLYPALKEWAEAGMPTTSATGTRERAA